AGSGRSRLLDAALLDASLRGLTTLRADARDAVSGEFGVLRALTGQLLSLLPELTRATAAPHAALLAQLLPELANADDLALDESLDPRRLRPRLQRTLLTWLAELSRQRPLAIAVDDFHRIDEPSAALLAALAGEIVPYSICLLCTVASDSDDEPSAASKLLVASSTQVPLQNLNEAQSWQLFASLFGDQPKLRLLAHRAHASCAGNPRDLLALAQHMIDRGVVRYEAGAFSVAAPIEAIELPRDMTQALQARIDALPEAARRLACALALCPDRSFSLNECCALVACDLRALRSQIDALVRADVVRRNGEQLQLSQRDFAPILERAVAVPERRVIHERLANIFARRGDEFRTVQQWFAADETARALDLLVRYIETEAETSAQDPGSLRFADIRSPAPNWIGTYERAMRACIELGRPRRDWFTFLNRRISVGGLLGIYEPAEVATLFEQLAADSGLADWARLDPNLDEHTRIASALQSTQTRYDETAEEQRVFDPATALRHIARTVISTLAMITGALDVDSLVALPNLRAFASLTPALRALADLTAGMIARFTGRLDEARAVYKQLLDAVGAPDRSGFDALRAEYVQLGVMNALGMIEAGLGLESALVWAARLEAHPVYEVNGVIIRMLHALYQTDFVAADGCKVLVQRLRILSSSRQMMEGGHLLWEVQALAIAEDLTRLRQVRDEIAPLAERYPAWRPVAYYAIGEYHRIRRAGDKALAELETALELARPGVHQLWPAIAASHLLALDSLGRIVEAISLGARYLADARERLAFEPDELVLADALVRARGGDAGAVDRVDGVIERLQRDQIAGLHLGYAHEMRARIALALDDRAAFERHAQACRGLYVERRNAALIAKAERLWQRSRGANSEAPSGPPDSAARSRVASALEECPDSAARAQVALSIVAAHGGAVDGCLFGLFGGALSCLARTANLMISDELVEQAKSYLTAQAHAFGTTATGSVRPSQRRSDSADENAQRYMPILLSHQREGRTTISGVVLLARGSGVALAYPTQLATEVSELLASYDDVEPLVVSD
ncbi:MAG TPA: AAA family ATPase, partial [Polyangiales bacterium]